MTTQTETASKTSGLSTVVNTIAAPREAFETLRTMPTWGWAFIIAAILLLVANFIQMPASQHIATTAMQRMTSTSPFLKNLPDAEKLKMLQNAAKPNYFSFLVIIVILLITVLLNTVLTLIGSAAGRGKADFMRLWCGSMNIAVPTLALGVLVSAIITLVRGPDNFSTQMDIARVLPSLAWLAPGAKGALAAFLATISIFTVWGFFLNAAMLQGTAQISKAVAYIFAAIVLLLTTVPAIAGAIYAARFGLA